ncbi:HIRAN domain-containing protein [Sphingomonas solaris]|uniref:HIRAN domain-containing protein n=1 Tax=Alterirhizorhabdus solaris TaxID=2529389 RepID=A0A558RDZ4_9SPHN|nr:HIRAN domain-containing protein [Sphingomonas solaris]TVV77412.1 hypothetical protein FOY91_01275 [Sphingomonas solaris]
MKQLSLHVVGANHPNADGSNRRFEILLCVPGERIELVPEPKNPADPNAVAVFSVRGVQIGYLTAERAPWIGGMVRLGREIQAVFQERTRIGAAIRVAFDGEAPVIPAASVPQRQSQSDPDDAGFWPDYLPPDD